jgi:hypothetical protein
MPHKRRNIVKRERPDSEGPKGMTKIMQPHMRKTGTREGIVESAPKPGVIEDTTVAPREHEIIIPSSVASPS